MLTVTDYIIIICSYLNRYRNIIDTIFFLISVFDQGCDADMKIGVSQLAITYGAIAFSFVLIAFLTTIVVVLTVRLKHSKPQILSSINKHVREGSTRIRNTLRNSFRRRNEVNSRTVTMSQSFRNRTVCWLELLLLLLTNCPVDCVNNYLNLMQYSY